KQLDLTQSDENPNRFKVAPEFADLPVEDLGEGIEELLPFEPIKEGCPWLRHVHNTGGADQDEPLWKLALNCCTFLAEGKNLIHKLSNKHADYNFADTEAKYAHARKDQRAKDLGWPLCQTICDNGSTHCKNCPHLAAKGSPLHLAHEGSNEQNGSVDSSIPGFNTTGSIPTPASTHEKLQLSVELGTKMWGPATKVGNEYRYGPDLSKAIDPRRGTWFDFETNRGGYIKDLMRKIEITANQKQPNINDVVL